MNPKAPGSKQNRKMKKQKRKRQPPPWRRWPIWPCIGWRVFRPLSGFVWQHVVRNLRQCLRLVEANKLKAESWRLKGKPTAFRRNTLYETKFFLTGFTRLRL
jgi:hypothetical protein